MASRNSRPSRLRNHFREHATAYQILIILGGLLLIFGGFIFFVRLFQAASEVQYEGEEVLEADELAALQAKPEDRTFPQPVEGDTILVRRVVEDALEAQGGRLALHDVKTILRRGTVRLFESGELQREMQVSLLFRAPDRIRYHYSLEGVNITAATDDEGAWKSIQRGERPPVVQELSAEETLLMRQDLHALQPLGTVLGDPSRLELIEVPDDRFPTPVYALSQDLGWIRETLYFDRLNLLLRRREAEMPLANGETMHIDVEYEDFRYAEGGLVFPFFLRVRVDGAIMNETVLEVVEVNVGALPILFERPEPIGD